MNNIIEQITKLTDEWYFLIGKCHHKDRDCHWYVETKWSYGQEPTYTVHHYGYILDKIEEEFQNYDDALIFLRDILKEKIEEERKHKEEDNGDGW